MSGTLLDQLNPDQQAAVQACSTVDEVKAQLEKDSLFDAAYRDKLGQQLEAANVEYAEQFARPGNSLRWLQQIASDKDLDDTQKNQSLETNLTASVYAGTQVELNRSAFTAGVVSDPVVQIKALNKAAKPGVSQDPVAFNQQKEMIAAAMERVQLRKEGVEVPDIHAGKMALGFMSAVIPTPEPESDAEVTGRYYIYPAAGCKGDSVKERQNEVVAALLNQGECSNKELNDVVNGIQSSVTQILSPDMGKIRGFLIEDGEHDRVAFHRTRILGSIGNVLSAADKTPGSVSVKGDGLIAGKEHWKNGEPRWTQQKQDGIRHVPVFDLSGKTIDPEELRKVKQDAIPFVGKMSDYLVVVKDEKTLAVKTPHKPLTNAELEALKENGVQTDALRPERGSRDVVGAFSNLIVSEGKAAAGASPGRGADNT